MAMSAHRQVRVLVVEDNSIDAELVTEALEATDARADVTVVEDGSEALAWLQEAAGRPNGNFPDLIFLDLKLPGVHGRDLLAFIKGDPRLMSVPVVVLSTSEDPADVSAAYGAYANAFVTKPVGVDEFIDTVSGTAAFWLTVARLPQRRRVAAHAVHQGDGADQLSL